MRNRRDGKTAKRQLLLIAVVVGLAVAFVPAVSSDGCGGLVIVSPGCQEAAVLAAVCLPAVILVLCGLLRPRATAWRAAPLPGGLPSGHDPPLLPLPPLPAPAPRPLRL